MKFQTFMKKTTLSKKSQRNGAERVSFNLIDPQFNTNSNKLSYSSAERRPGERNPFTKCGAIPLIRFSFLQL